MADPTQGMAGMLSKLVQYLEPTAHPRYDEARQVRSMIYAQRKANRQARTQDRFQSPKERAEWHRDVGDFRARVAKVADTMASRHFARLPSEEARSRAYQQMLSNPKTFQHLLRQDPKLMKMGQHLRKRWRTEPSPALLERGPPIRLETPDVRPGVG